MSSIDSSYFMKDLCPSENITVSFHPHPLRLKDAHETPYYCVGCKEKGFGKCYQCEDPENCDYHLHRQCCDLSTLCESGSSSSIKFTFLESKKCDFVFQKEAPGANQRGCDACGRDVKGWSYQCKMCKIPHYLHPCCAKLPINQKWEKGIVLDLTAKTSSKCLECLLCRNEVHSKNFRSWVYVSRCRNYCYHVSCMKDNVEKGAKDEASNQQPSYETRTTSGALVTRAQKQDVRPRRGETGLDLLEFAVDLAIFLISVIFGIPFPSVSKWIRKIW